MAGSADERSWTLETGFVSTIGAWIERGLAVGWAAADSSLAILAVSEGQPSCSLSDAVNRPYDDAPRRVAAQAIIHDFVGLRGRRMRATSSARALRASMADSPGPSNGWTCRTLERDLLNEWPDHGRDNRRPAVAGVRAPGVPRPHAHAAAPRAARRPVLARSRRRCGAQRRAHHAPP